MQRISKGAVLWTLTLGFMVLGLVYLFSSGQLGLYLHPRHWRGLAWGTLLLGVLCLVSIQHWRSQWHLSWAHAIFLLPVILGLCWQPQMLTLEVVEQKGILFQLPSCGSGCSNSDAVHLPVILGSDDTIVLTSENWLSVMEALWEETGKYLGREVEMLGFVYDDPTLGTDDFVLVRLVMTCCAADAEVAGLLCRFPQRGHLQVGQWALVRGRLAQTSFYNVHTGQILAIPYIEVEELQPADKPTQEYVYP